MEPSLHLFTKTRKRDKVTVINHVKLSNQAHRESVDFSHGRQRFDVFFKKQNNKNRWTNNYSNWTQGRSVDTDNTTPCCIFTWWLHLASRPAVDPPLPLELELLVFLGSSSGVLWLGLPLLLLQDDAEEKMWQWATTGQTSPETTKTTQLILFLSFQWQQKDMFCHFQMISVRRKKKRDKENKEKRKKKE